MNLRKNWELKIDSSVLKSMKKIPHEYMKKIDSVLDVLSTSPYFGDVRKIKGKENIWRCRVGSYRIFYEIEKEKSIIVVFHIEKRNSKTY